MKEDFACAADAKKASTQLSRSWKYHCLESVEIETHPRYNYSSTDFTFSRKPLSKILFDLLACMQNVHKQLEEFYSNTDLII